MKLILGIIYLAAVVFSFRGSPAQAQADSTKAPGLWEPKTFSVGVGAGYEAVVPEGQGITTQGPTAVAYIARPLDQFAFQALGSWQFSNGSLRVSPGIHYRFQVLGEHFAGALDYDFYAYHDVPTPANEWAVGILWSRQLVGNLVLGASARYGLDTHPARYSAQLTLPLHTARN